MTVEEKPNVIYVDIKGYKDQLDKIREILELSLLNPEKFVNLGIDPSKGVLLYGPPGTRKILFVRAIAKRTDTCFIRCIWSELVQKYIGERARLIRELFNMTGTKKISYK